MQSPWQMTRKEWEAEVEKARPNTAQSRLTKHSGAQAVARYERMQFLKDGAQSADPALVRVQHRDVIAKALAEGQPVPAAVLADYPEMGVKGADGR